MRPSAPANLVKVTDQSVDGLIDKYVAALGGKQNLMSIRSLKMTGKLVREGGIPPTPLLIEKQRPHQLLRRLEERPPFLQAVEGSETWEIFPPAGPNPRPMPPWNARRFQHWAPIESPLVDYRAKGSQVELLGKGKAGHADVYVLKITFKDGDVSYLSLDAKGFLLVRNVERAQLRGQETDVETAYENYQRVGAVLFPYAESSTLLEPGVTQTMAWDRIEINVPINEEDFKPPKG